MPLAQTASASRPTLGFTLEGLTGREETLFKAFIRLLDHRTLQQWVYRPSRPDLRVVADSVASDTVRIDAIAPDANCPLLLTISSAPGQRQHCVSLPLRADELEAELNSLGQLRVGAGSVARPLPPQASFRLLRWPPAELLGTPERVHFATLMVSKPFTLAWVQERSGLAPAACAQFFAELHDAALLAAVPSTAPEAAAASAEAPSATVAPPASAGLIARIRSRLGLLVRSGPQ